MPRRCASAGVDGDTACPVAHISPVSGRITPVSNLISVDLPAPFWPLSACTSPARRIRSTSSSAATPEKRLPSPRACRTISASPLVMGSVLAAWQRRSGLVLGEHPLLHQDPLGQRTFLEHGFDRLDQLVADQRIAFDRGVELARLHRLERAAYAVDGNDPDVLARLQPGLLDGLDRTDRHIVVVREQHVDFRALGFEERLHHFLALGPGEIAALRAHHLEARILVYDLMESFHT